jgi:DNA-binding transcriptional ArsR family regulator
LHLPRSEFSIINAHDEPIFHPDREDLELVTVLRALADPTRLEIVRILAADPTREIACGSFGIEASKQNLSHHFRVLRAAGVARSRDEGRNRFTSLRLDDLNARFPGLLASVIESEATVAAGSTK